MKRKVGPLPLWGWMVAIGLGVAVFVIQRRHAAAGAGAGVSQPAGGNIDPKTGLPYSLENIDPNTGLPYYLSQVQPPPSSSGSDGSGGSVIPGMDLATQLQSLAGIIQAYQTLGQLFNPSFPAPGQPQQSAASTPAKPAPVKYRLAPGVTLQRGQKLVPGASAVYRGHVGVLRPSGGGLLGFHPIYVHGHYVKA